ncbi:MAG TPA: maleylpyruvate isomerase family mycothiol-dependent enzyme [Acidimicrobiales bacterium]
MERDDYDRVLRSSIDRMAVAAEGNLERPVPSCPGWTVADLLSHVTTVLSFFGAVAAGGADAPSDWAPPQRPADDELVAWFRAETGPAAAAVMAPDPSEPRWSWSHQHDAGFTQRRMAQEFAVHAWDVENALGAPDPIGVAVAVDGIDEYLDIFLPAKEVCLAGPELTAHLHTTDADGEWMLTIGEGAHHLERAHGKGDVAVRAPAGDLLLWVWGRRRADAPGFETFGDEATLTEFRTRIRQW